MEVAFADVMVIVVPAATAPATGLNVGVACAFVIVYDALDMALLVHPVLTAIAFKVNASFMATGPVYSVLDIVGSVPLVV